MRRWGRIIALVCVAVLITTMMDRNNGTYKVYAADYSGMRDISAADIVADMGLGWNLGNTFDCVGSYVDNKTNNAIVAYYMDKTNYTWNMTDSTACSWDSNDTVSGTLTWDMSKLKSTDDSLPSTIGFQVWNFSSEVKNGTEITATVTKAELKTNSKVYTFPELLGAHTIIFKNGVASFGITSFDKALNTSGQLKQGTFTLTVELTPTASRKSKEEYFETLWGNPLTTKALIDQIKLGGFQAVRMPVTWNVHTDAQGNIDKAWMDRVEQVVKYVLDNNMYCIVNMHHDTGHQSLENGSGWLKADTSDPAMEKRYAYIWEQIAQRFKNYGDHLLFEGFNEILTTDSKGNDIWGYPGTTATTAVNHLNQLFVDTVRSTGGNNAKRFLVVNTYAASTAQSTIDDFILPKDTIRNHLIVEVHDYTPTDFAWYVDWTTPRDTWGTPKDKADLDGIFERLDKRFIQKGIPVIVGEFNSNNKNNTAERQKHASYYVSGAKAKGITCFWWDEGGVFEVGADDIYKGAGLINRRTAQWAFPELLDTLKKAAFGDSVSADQFNVTKVSAQTYTGKSLRPTFTVSCNSKTLMLNTDYNVSYSNNVLPGKADVTITGIGDYYGSIHVTFTILPDKPTIKRVTSSKSSTVYLLWGKVPGASGYQIYSSTCKDGSYKPVGTTAGSSMDIPTLTKGKTYYFKIKAYVTIDGKKVYGSFSNIFSVKVK